MRRFIIDTDTASDDAVALVMALQSPDVEVVGITLVAGNVPVDQGVQNALYTVELCGKRVPVYQGAEKPLMKPLASAVNVHGNDGMGSIGLDLSGRKPAEGHAVDMLVELINRYANDITLVTLGPLTNIALALTRDPSLAKKVTRCVTMGGTSDAYGNASPVAEYNIWEDPEAAKIVFQSGMPITMVGWDISRKYAVITEELTNEIRAIDTPLARFAMDIQGHVLEFCKTVTCLEGFDLPDPIAMAVAIDESVATETVHCYVDVETQGELTRGQTVIDYLNLRKREPNVNVVVKASQARFLQMLRKSLA